MLLLRQWVEEAEAVARQNADEIRQRRILEHEDGPMLSKLRERGNTALGNICEVAVDEHTQSTMPATFSSSPTW